MKRQLVKDDSSLSYCYKWHFNEKVANHFITK
jgi:hypothetical protein